MKFISEPVSQQDFIGLLEKIITRIPVRSVFYAQRSDHIPRSELVEIHPYLILDIPLSGRKKISFHSHGELNTQILTPGEILYTGANVWKMPDWKSYHELCCLVFTADYLRITYVDFNMPQPKGQRPVRRSFYHSSAPPGEDMKRILRVMQSLGVNGDPENAGAAIANGLLRMALAFIRSSEIPVHGKAQGTYWKVRQYLEENFSRGDCSREEAARLFHLTPAYLSRLFSEQGNQTFHDTLRELRMEHAAWLLLNTELLVDEVAFRCGYESSTFFTSAFKACHQLPPGAYRRQGKDTFQ